MMTSRVSSKRMPGRGIAKPAPQADGEGAIAERVENNVAANMLAQGLRFFGESGVFMR
jgi:hypothetical protein